MNMSDAEVGDVYVDDRGTLYRVKTIEREPVITVEAVEGYLYDPNVSVAPNAAVGIGVMNSLWRIPAEIKKPSVKRGIEDEY